MVKVPNESCQKNQDVGRLVSVVSSLGLFGQIWNTVSVLMFMQTGGYDVVKWNLEKEKNTSELLWCEMLV